VVYEEQGKFKVQCIYGLKKLHFQCERNRPLGLMPDEEEGEGGGGDDD
jgi:hypothetical protein